MRTGQWVLMRMSKPNIQESPSRKVGFMTKKVGFMNKCTSRGTESLYGWLYIIKLNRPVFRRVKGMNLRVRSTEQKTVVCFSENEDCFLTLDTHGISKHVRMGNKRHKSSFPTALCTELCAELCVKKIKFFYLFIAILSP